MPLRLAPQQQQLRTQIARSRRRLDRHARGLVSDATRFVPIARVAAGKGRWAVLAAVVAGAALSGWAREPIRRWWNQLLGKTVSRWLDRLMRRLRVALRRSSRDAEPEATESSDE